MHGYLLSVSALDSKSAQSVCFSAHEHLVNQAENPSIHQAGTGRKCFLCYGPERLFILLNFPVHHSAHINQLWPFIFLILSKQTRISISTLRLLHGYKVGFFFIYMHIIIICYYLFIWLGCSSPIKGGKMKAPINGGSPAIQPARKKMMGTRARSKQSVLDNPCLS